jgi:protein associated with RNAse G/E
MQIRPKIMLIDSTKQCIIKIWHHETTDIDSDGTKYHRCLILKHCCDEPFRLKVEDFDIFIKKHINSKFKIIDEK